MDEVFQSLISLYSNPIDRINVLIKVFQNSGYNTTTKTLMNTQDDDTASLLRLYALSYLSYTIPNIEFSSSSEAMDLIRSIRPLFEAELTDKNINGDTFSWLSRIYNKCIADISTRGSQLPQITAFYCNNLPIPVVSQYLYLDGSRSDEILIRNNKNIKHPLFYDGKLEVLTS